LGDAIKRVPSTLPLAGLCAYAGSIPGGPLTLRLRVGPQAETRRT